jgi:hypothetical protein
MKKKEMKLKRSSNGRYLRFCEICGSHAGVMTLEEWYEEGHMCKRCAEIYASSLEIEIDRANGLWRSNGHSWELDGERKRISRFL